MLMTAAAWLVAFLCIISLAQLQLKVNPWRRLQLSLNALLIIWLPSLLLLRALPIRQPVWRSLILKKASWKLAWANMAKVAVAANL